MHYYSFNPAAYTLDTAHLSDAEDLAYRRLLDFYYTSEAPIPTETQPVSRRLRLGFEVVESVLHEFFELRETGWHQRRCDAEIAEYHKKADSARENGRKGGRPKLTAAPTKKTQAEPRITQPVNLANPAETGSKANQEPVTKNQEPVKKKQKPAASLPDFIESIRNLPAYAGIDIDMELSKMDAWLLTPKGRGRKKSERFVLNWLGKADRELPRQNGHTTPYINPRTQDPAPHRLFAEPDDWKAGYREAWGGDPADWKSWQDLTTVEQSRIISLP